MASHRDLQAKLRSLADPADAAFLARFFKTGPGQYGEGDVLIGVRVPAIRSVAKEFGDLPLAEVRELLHSAVHEDRLAALVILCMQASRGDERTREAICRLYLDNTRFINNWDLVDVSAPQIVGAYLADRDRSVLDGLAGSASLWERRISILATLHFIRGGEMADTLRIAHRLLADPQDLIHKAVGWMLREVGKRDLPALEAFLRRHARSMPRTMLRYAIERFPEPQRKAYLALKREKTP